MKSVPKGCTSTYLVQFNLLLLGEVAVAVFEVFQNHFLQRSIAERGLLQPVRLSTDNLQPVEPQDGRGGTCHSL